MLPKKRKYIEKFEKKIKSWTNHHWEASCLVEFKVNSVVLVIFDAS